MTEVEATVRSAILDGISSAWGPLGLKPEDAVDNILENLFESCYAWAVVELIKEKDGDTDESTKGELK